MTDSRQGDAPSDPKSIPSVTELAASMEAAVADDGRSSAACSTGPASPTTAPARANPAVQPPKHQHADAPYCMQCGVQMIRAGTCHACPSCGSTSGCS